MTDIKSVIKNIRKFCRFIDKKLRAERIKKQFVKKEIMKSHENMLTFQVRFITLPSDSIKTNILQKKTPLPKAWYRLYISIRKAF